MITIGRLHDLKQFGIHPLTGEADALSYRVLCDLTRRGAGYVAQAYGLQRDAFPENWNPGDKNDPHVASCMLGYEAYQQIAPIVLCDRCHTVIATDDGCYYGLVDGEEHLPATWEFGEDGNITETSPAKLRLQPEDSWHRWPTCYGEIRRYFRTGRGPHVADRNVHAMSGRTV